MIDITLTDFVDFLEQSRDAEAHSCKEREKAPHRRLRSANGFLSSDSKGNRGYAPKGEA